MKIPIVGGSNEARSVNQNSQKCINLYPVVEQRGGKSGGALYSTMGTELFANIPKSPIRGVLTSKDGNMYVVALNSFYKVDTSGTVTLLGSMALESGTVSMAENLTQIMIITENYGYIWDGTTLATITDPDFVSGGEVILMNGYFVFNDPATDAFWITGYQDGTTVDALEFSYANVDADKIISIVGQRQELWIFGEYSVEIWKYDGNIDFPFDRIDGATFDIGCVAKKSIAKGNNGLIWLSQSRRGNGQVMMSQGYQYVAVSTPEIEHAINQYSTLSDATAYIYQEEGYEFYVISFPTGDATWVYNITLNLWHQWAWFDENGDIHRHRGNYYAFIGNEHYVTDHESLYIYKMSHNIYTDYNIYDSHTTFTGTTYPITRVRTFQHANNEANRVFWKKLQIDMEVGLGNELGSDPTIQLRWSDDGGHAYGDVHIGSIGKIGEYAHRVIWRRLGQSRNRVYELRTAEPVQIAIMDAYADVEVVNG